MYTVINICADFFNRLRGQSKPFYLFAIAFFSFLFFFFLTFFSQCGVDIRYFKRPSYLENCQLRGYRTSNKLSWNKLESVKYG